MFSFINLSNSFFYSSEFFLFFNIFFLLLFILGKQIIFNLKFFFNIRVNFFFFFYRALINYGFFSFFVLLYILYIFFSLKFFLFNMTYVSDSFSVFIKFLVVLFSFIVFIFSFYYFEQELIFKSFEYYFLFLLSILSMFFLISSNDLLVLYLTIEMQSLCFYILTTFRQNSIFSIEAGLKYFILGSFSSGLLIYGSSFIYGLTGLTNFCDIDFFFQQLFVFKNNYLLVFGFFLFLSAILFKFTAAPFHIWAPDVYQGAPSIVTFFFSIVPKIVFLGLFIRFVFDIFSNLSFILKMIISIATIMSLLFGAFGSIFQSKIKRLLAYSSISNVGYLTLGLLCGNMESFISILLYFLMYCFSLLGIFVVLLSFRNYVNLFKSKNIFEFFGVFNLNFLFSFFFVINLFSMIGLPPLIGFFGKFYIFLNVLGSNFFFLLYVGILGSLLSSIVYLKIIRLIFLNKQVNYIFFLVPFLRGFTIILTLTFFVNILVFFDFNLFIKFFYNLIFSNYKGFLLFSFFC